MRAKRVRAIVDGAVVTASERRLLKEQYKAAKRAKAGVSKDPSTRRGRLWTAKPPVGPAAFRKSRITSALHGAFSEVTDRTKFLILKLLVGKLGGTREKKRPIPGTGEASKLNRLELQRRVAVLAARRGIKNYVERA